MTEARQKRRSESKPTSTFPTYTKDAIPLQPHSLTHVFSHSQDLADHSPVAGPADAPSVTTALPASEVKKQRQLRPAHRPARHRHYPHQQTRQTSAVSGAVAIGHSADLRIQPQLKGNNGGSKTTLGSQLEVCIAVHISLSAVLTSRTPAYRNLKTIPSNVHRTSDQAVLRPHVNQDTAEDTQNDRTQGLWSDPLAAEGYGMEPVRPMEPQDLQETGHAPQRIELLDLLPAVEPASVGTHQGSTGPDPYTRHPSDDGASPEEVASQHLGRQASISTDLSEYYYSILGEVKEENIQSLLPGQYTKLEDGIVEEILELTNKYDILSEKVDGIAEGNQELLEEVQSMSENISTLIGSMRPCATPSDSPSPLQKKSGLPKRRAVEALVLAASVREYLAVLLRAEDVGLASVSVEDASKFAKLCDADEAGDCCTKDDFRVDLIGTPRSRWNKSAANVFVDAFEEFTSVELEETLVRTAFFTRLKTLKQEFKLSKKSKREQQNSIVQRRRKMRKRTLFTQRYDTAMNDPRLHKHLGLLERLGVDGMSSDESDEEDTGPTGLETAGPIFRVRRPIWRAQIVSRWLQAFDSLHLKRRQVSQDKRGCYPRIRVRSSPFSSSRSFVAGLPSNAYDQSWMVRQSQGDVRATKEHGDFSHLGATE